MRRLALAGGICVLLIGATPASAQTRADYAAQVNPICAAATEDADRILGKAGFKNPKQISRLFERLDDVEERTIAAIAEVPPPPPDTALVAAWIDSLRRINELGGKVGRASVRVFRLVLLLPKQNPVRKLKRLSRRLNRLGRRLVREFEESSALATQLGVLECTGDVPRPKATG